VIINPNNPKGVKIEFDAYLEVKLEGNISTFYFEKCTISSKGFIS